MNNVIRRMWILNNVDDGVDFLDEDDLEEFFLVNEETFTHSEISEIRNLAPGETFKDGGGAAPVWSIRRMTVDELREGDLA